MSEHLWAQPSLQLLGAHANTRTGHIMPDNLHKQPRRQRAVRSVSTQPKNSSGRSPLRRAGHGQLQGNTKPCKWPLAPHQPGQRTTPANSIAMLCAGAHVHLPGVLPMVVARQRTKTIPPWVHVCTHAECTLVPAHDQISRTASL